MTDLGRLLMKHNAVRYDDDIVFIGRCSRMSIPEFVSWARTVEFGRELMTQQASNVIQFPKRREAARPCDVGDE